MMTEEQFNRLVDRIMALGYDEETAADYAYRIGDTPLLDGDGNVIVRGDDGTVLAVLKLRL